MVAWAFHRISGIGVWLFVVLHVIDIYLVGRTADGQFAGVRTKAVET